jgi:hypothetical protein
MFIVEQVVIDWRLQQVAVLFEPFFSPPLAKLVDSARTVFSIHHLGMLMGTESRPILEVSFNEEFFVYWPMVVYGWYL